MPLKLNASPRSSRMLIQKLKLKIPTCKFLEKQSQQEGSKRSFLMRNQLLLWGGTHVYETAQGRAAIREMNDGFQVVKVVEEKSDTSDMVVSFPGRHLEQMEDGRVIIRQGGEYGEPVGVIDPAWAKGADGAEVATRFETSGSELVQVVVPGPEAKFPVVADPRVRTAWYGASIDFTKQETTRMAAGWGACAAVMAVVPDFTSSKALAAACGVLSAVAGGAASEGKCVSVKFVPLSPVKVVPWLTRCYA